MKNQLPIALSLSELQIKTLALLDQLSATKERLFTCNIENRAVEFLLLTRRLVALDILPIRNLLEIGCGDGFSLRLWAEIAEYVTGIDLPSQIQISQKLLTGFPPQHNNISLVESAAEDFQTNKKYDVVVTQYVLEHVMDIDKTLSQIHDSLNPNGFAIHVLNNSVSRLSWYIQYRSQSSLPRRIYYSLRDKGLWRTLLNPLNHTTPHEPHFGSFDYELDEYRLDRWTLRLMRAHFEVVDWFQTADFNYVLISRPFGHSAISDD